MTTTAAASSSPYVVARLPKGRDVYMSPLLEFVSVKPQGYVWSAAA